MFGSDNKLSLHLGKTESILFDSKRKLANCRNLNVTCNKNNTESKASCQIFWSDHRQGLSGEFMAFSIIQKANNNSHVKRTLSSSLIQCHLDYGCTSYFSSLFSKLKFSLQTSQNKLKRFGIENIIGRMWVLLNL